MKAGRLILPLFIGFVATGSLAETAAAEQQQASGIRVRQVENSVMDMAYMDPDADFAAIKRIYISPLNLNDVRIVQPETSAAKPHARWTLTDADQKALQQSYAENISKEILQGEHFKIAKSTLEADAYLHASVFAIHPTAPKDDFRSRDAQSKIITSGAGSLTVAFSVVDIKSGKTVVRAIDTKSDNRVRMLNNKVTNMAAAGRIFRSWGFLLRERLLFLQGKKSRLRKEPKLAP